MIVILKEKSCTVEVDSLISDLKSSGLDVHISRGVTSTVLCVIGNTAAVDTDRIKQFSCVADIKRIQEPSHRTGRKFHPENTVITVKDAVFGSNELTVTAGPCSVESEEQIISIARQVKAAGAKLLRGGAFKPRTSPYSFQGLREEGIKLLLAAKKEVGLPIVSEIMDTAHLDLFADVDVIQVGARNMQNFELLKQLGRCGKPILLKRGFGNTCQELLMSAEYILTAGNENVILCERGICTFENSTRNTLDISAVPVLKKLSHLPVVVDPSHAAGTADIVPPLAYAACACGADGLLIEVHNAPECARCDGGQSLTPEKFAEVMRKLGRIKAALNEDRS